MTEAHEKYIQVRHEIAAELKKLEEELFEHNQHAAPRPHWGHVGDMQHILAELKKLNGEE